MPLPRPTRQPTKEKAAETPVEGPLSPEDFRPSDVFRFDPKPDITPDELAYLVSVFWELDLNYNRYFGLDPEIQRHFQPLKIEKKR